MQRLIEAKTDITLADILNKKFVENKIRFFACCQPNLTLEIIENNKNLAEALDEKEVSRCNQIPNIEFRIVNETDDKFLTISFPKAVLLRSFTDKTYLEDGRAMIYATVAHNYFKEKDVLPSYVLKHTQQYKDLLKTGIEMHFNLKKQLKKIKFFHVAIDKKNNFIICDYFYKISHLIPKITSPKNAIKATSEVIQSPRLLI